MQVINDMDEINDMIEDCINRESKLSDWEIKFIDSIQDKSYLTQKQYDKLSDIWDRITA